MTTEDQDAEIGRLVRERRELRAHYEALIAKAETTGKLLSCIGHALPPIKASGAKVPIEIQPDGAVKVADQHQSTRLVTGRIPTAQELSELIGGIASDEARLAELDQRLKVVGA